MGSSGYEIGETQWLAEVQKLTSKGEIFVSIKWSFGVLLGISSLFQVSGRTISIVLHRGSPENLSRLLLTLEIPDSGVQFLRKVDEKNHFLLAAYLEESIIGFADSLEALNFASSELHVQ
jgi:hypothetical protein